MLGRVVPNLTDGPGRGRLDMMLRLLTQTQGQLVHPLQDGSTTSVYIQYDLDATGPEGMPLDLVMALAVTWREIGRMCTHLGENDGHGEVLALSRHVSQHHDPRQPQASLAVTQRIDDCWQAHHSSQSPGTAGNTQAHAGYFVYCHWCLSQQVCVCVWCVCVCVQYLWWVLHHLLHQSGDVLPHKLVWVSEAGQGCREDLGLDHHLCQADRVLADLTEGWEHLPLHGHTHNTSGYSHSSFVPTKLLLHVVQHLCGNTCSLSTSCTCIIHLFLNVVKMYAFDPLVSPPRSQCMIAYSILLG